MIIQDLCKRSNEQLLLNSTSFVSEMDVIDTAIPRQIELNSNCKRSKLSMTVKVLPKSIDYPPNTVKRADRALFCSPFKLNLFTAMRDRSIPLPDMTETTGVEKNYTKKALTENQAESYLMWLIQVGILRREVDGQGLTDSFRLTPLGRQSVAKWQPEGDFPRPSLQDRISNWFNRWLQWSF